MSNASATFSRDLLAGQEVERKQLANVHRVCPDAHIIQGYFKGYDIYIPCLDIGIEVKSDIKSQETGNIVVEISCNGKPSALTTTTAEFWIFDTGVKTILVHIGDLRKLVKKFRPVTFTGAGDDYTKDAYLIPQEYVESIRI